MTMLSRVFTGIRGRHLLLIDLLGNGIAAYLAIALRFDRVFALDFVQTYFPAVLAPLLIRPVLSVRLGLYSRQWRFASIPELERIILTTVAGSAASAVVILGVLVPFGEPSAVGFPRSFFIIEGLLSMLFVGGVRFGIRAAFEWSSQRSSGETARSGIATLLYGAGTAGVTMVRSARREPRAGVRPVGFLDDDKSRYGTTAAGLRIYGGVDALPGAVQATGATRLLITMPDASGVAVRRVVDAALAIGLDVHTVPPVHELLDGSFDAFRVRRVRVEDLLRRPVMSDPATGIEHLVRNRTVLVTGAGGSIGSELARQLHDFSPARVILVDRAETPLYEIERELERRTVDVTGSRGARVQVESQLANVANRAAMERIIAATAPDIIFHAAAYKHVPMMEMHPSDAVHVNIRGTQACVDAAIAANVERFVLVSTDKAVEPSSVMGASKRAAELIVSDAAKRTGRAYASVRFGNVLGSAGSVVPMFQRQLEEGKPLTLTHPDMTRYFMTIPEAVRLILHAATIGQAGDVFVLDMGDPVKVIDLARDLIRLTGRDPDSVPIEITGIRPGEKLHERLYYDVEHVDKTTHPKIFRVIEQAPFDAGLRDRLDGLFALADGTHDEALRLALFALVATHEPFAAESPVI